MATVYFLYRSTRKKGNLSVRLQDVDTSGKKFQFEAKTVIEVTKRFWEKTRHKKRNVDATDKKEIAAVNAKLSQIEEFILDQYRELSPTPDEKDWLKEQLKLFYNPSLDEPLSQFVTDWIKKVISTANTRENATGGLGISKSRINSYKNLLKIFSSYEGKNRIRVKQIDSKFGKDFLGWLINKRGYSESYAKKKIDDLKTVCFEAELHGIEVSPQLRKVKGGKSSHTSIIYLTPEELKKIRSTDLDSDSLINTRKWLLLGCSIGQRGGDLLSITEENFLIRSGLEVIEITQQKTGKNVTIPVLPETKEILEEGFPYPIPIQKFNNQLKKLCKKAGIDTPTKGTKIVMLDEEGKEIEKDGKGRYSKQGVKRKIAGTFPKYELIASHVCRRTFATNQYGKLPTPLIMQITAHSTEKMLLGYIGKASLDYAQQIADYYSKEAKKNQKETTLEVIRRTSNN